MKKIEKLNQSELDAVENLRRKSLEEANKFFVLFCGERILTKSQAEGFASVLQCIATRFYEDYRRLMWLSQPTKKPARKPAKPVKGE